MKSVYKIGGMPHRIKIIETIFKRLFKMEQLIKVQQSETKSKNENI